MHFRQPRAMFVPLKELLQPTLPPAASRLRDLASASNGQTQGSCRAEPNCCQLAHVSLEAHGAVGIIS